MNIGEQINRNDINIAVEVNYRPGEEANLENERENADNDSVTYVY